MNTFQASLKFLEPIVLMDLETRRFCMQMAVMADKFSDVNTLIRNPISSLSKFKNRWGGLKIFVY